MSEYTDEKLEDIGRKVRALIANAEDPATPDEARDSYRQRAEALMLKYRIAESTAVAAGTSSSVPVWRAINLDVHTSEFAQWYYKLVGVVMRHTGVRGEYSWDHADGRTVLTMNAVGYASDINYMEMLMTACMVEFAKRLEPRFDPKLSLSDNIYNMRSAGMERKRIAKVVFGDWSTENEMKAKNRKVTAHFKAACEERGEDSSVLLGRGNNMASYREDYADGFVNTFAVRLIRLRAANTEETGGGLVLVDRADAVNEAFYLKYPHRRPDSNPNVWNDPRADCAKCKKASSGYCREHQYLKPSEAQHQGRRVNGAARSRGGLAASMVDLGHGSAGRGRASGTDRRELA